MRSMPASAFCAATPLNSVLSLRSLSSVRVLAEAVASLSGRAYIVLAPFVGVLGSFMTGSNTVSNVLFAQFQYDTAAIVGFAPVMMVTLQVVGGAIGNMVCVNNIVAVSATVGISGVEGTVIRRNIIPAAIYSVLAVVVVLVLSTLE
ncbi:MAG: L-lactate permease [Spirochaetales bacterium]|nr:MAG: L-lactate permease [Spirochaetales bacterium]